MGHPARLWEVDRCVNYRKKLELSLFQGATRARQRRARITCVALGEGTCSTHS
jgi:hypothetical protein